MTAEAGAELAAAWEEEAGAWEEEPLLEPFGVLDALADGLGFTSARLTSLTSSSPRSTARLTRESGDDCCRC
jgi:hypothetical protein